MDCLKPAPSNPFGPCVQPPLSSAGLLSV